LRSIMREVYLEILVLPQNLWVQESKRNSPLREKIAS
jgi:hypothetical protein